MTKRLTTPLDAFRFFETRLGEFKAEPDSFIASIDEDYILPYLGDLDSIDLVTLFERLYPGFGETESKLFEVFGLDPSGHSDRIYTDWYMQFDDTIEPDDDYVASVIWVEVPYVMSLLIRIFSRLTDRIAGKSDSLAVFKCKVESHLVLYGCDLRLIKLGFSERSSQLVDFALVKHGYLTSEDLVKYANASLDSGISETEFLRLAKLSVK